MKKKLLLFLGITVIAFWGCGPAKQKNANDLSASLPLFSVSVTEDPSFTNLPPLMSFVHGSYQGTWILFSGRTNGFHGFLQNGEKFPKKKANEYIYVYNAQSHSLDSIQAPKYGGDTGNVFLCTNLANTQQGNYLYACGGYGVALATDSFADKTYSYFMRMNLQTAIPAVQNHDTTAFKNSINWGKSEMVRSTGGELYQLPDGNFYMSVGHRFTGIYANDDTTSPNREKQEYVDRVNVFSLQQGTNGALTLNSISVITDGLPDSTTQFRRRDLVVAPCVQPNGTDIGLAIYGGVFHFIDGGIQFNGTPFHNPIYINYTQNPPFRVDSFAQWTNIYSTAFMSMFVNVGSLKCMTTTLFGGLGDSLNNPNAFNNANWTKVISTNARVYFDVTHNIAVDVTTSFQNPDTLPKFIGAESIFIPASGVPFFNETYKIINYQGLTSGQTVGYIYGGITSHNATDPAGGGSTTYASNKVYQVVITKN